MEIFFIKLKKKHFFRWNTSSKLESEDEKDTIVYEEAGESDSLKNKSNLTECLNE